MKKKKMSLEEFKKNAENFSEKDLLNNVKGGKWSDCHGFLGPIGKFVRGEKDDITWVIG